MKVIISLQTMYIPCTRTSMRKQKCHFTNCADLVTLQAHDVVLRTAKFETIIIIHPLYVCAMVVSIVFLVSCHVYAF